jgi:hypothetical protein
VLVLLAGLYAGVTILLREPNQTIFSMLGFGVMLGSLGLCIVSVRSGRIGDALLAVEPREAAQAWEEGAASDEDAPSFRLTRFRQALRVIAPDTSAYGTAWIVCLAILFSAASFPMMFDLPVFMEVELVILVAYLLVAATLTRILYRGDVLEDDRVFVAPQSPLEDVDPSAPPQASLLERYAPRRCGEDGCSAAGCEEGGIFALVLVAIIAIVVFLLSLAWVIVEVALPIVFVICYELVLLAVRHASRDRVRCKGDLLRSSVRGALIAAMYVAPVGAVTYLLHRAL